MSSLDLRFVFRVKRDMLIVWWHVFLYCALLHFWSPLEVVMTLMFPKFAV